MTDIALDEKALEAGAEAVLELWRRQGLENCSSLEMAEEAIRAYLRTSPSQVAPQPQSGGPVADDAKDLLARECLFAAQEARKSNGRDTYSSRVLDKAASYLSSLASPQPANPALVTDALAEALKPFADAASVVSNDIPDETLLFAHFPSLFGGQTEIRVGDLRKARAALSKLEPAGDDADFKDYDAGLLNDFGGGNVEWWQDYLRAEIGRANDFWREQAAALTAAIGAGGQAVAEDWRDDPSADERWNAGLDYGQTQLCAVLGVDPRSIDWDAATETLDGDVRAVIGKILTARFGDDWPSAFSQSHPADERVVEALRAAYEKVKLWPENRMPGVDVTELGEGFMDLLALRNLIPDVLAALSATEGR